MGCGFVIAPVYIAEITPPDIRGRLVSLTDVCINVGIVLGAVAGFLCEQIFTSDDVKWRVMLGIGIIPPIVILLCLRHLPESPRWLLLRRRGIEARAVLRLIMGSEREAEAEAAHIIEAIRMEQDVTSDWSEVLWPRHRAILLPVLMGLALGFFQQANGSEAAVYYSPQILAEAGVTSRSQQSLVSASVLCGLVWGGLALWDDVRRSGRPTDSHVIICIIPPHHHHTTGQHCRVGVQVCRRDRRHVLHGPPRAQAPLRCQVRARVWVGGFFGGGGSRVWDDVAWSDMTVHARPPLLFTNQIKPNQTNAPCHYHSAVGSGVFLVAAGLSFQQRWPPTMLMASLCLFMGFFSLGMGAITFVVASELFPLPVRGKAMALTVFVNRLLR